MKKTNSDLAKEWLVDNAWNLIVTFTAIVIAFSYLQYRVQTNDDKIKDIVDKISKYPSTDYFELRFSYIEKELREIKTELKNAGGD